MMPRLLKSRITWVVLVVAGLAAVFLWQLGAVVRPERRFPFQMEFGRGSGWHGLNTVHVSQEGTVTLHELHKELVDNDTCRHVWKMTTFKLSDEAIGEIIDSVDRNGIWGLSKTYRDKSVADGTQWVLWVEQDGLERVVSCDNRFPDRIIRFARELDDILTRNGLETAVWQRAEDADARKHELKLWNRIRPSSPE